jgi:hypothetical protein
MPEGPIAVNVFARLHEADAFVAVCRRMRLESTTAAEITRAWRLSRGAFHRGAVVLRLIPMQDG